MGLTSASRKSSSVAPWEMPSQKIQEVILCITPDGRFVMETRQRKKYMYGIPLLYFLFFIKSAIVCPLLNFGLPPCCPQVVWCHWGEIEPLSVTLAQDALAECDQPGKNPLKYSAVAGNWTRATGRTDGELTHWAIMTISVWCYFVDLVVVVASIVVLAFGSEGRVFATSAVR